MFNALHALAQNSTLMLVIASAADGQLRVSINPTYIGDKPTAHPLKPLVVVAPPDELDADFAQAIGIWHAPKRSLIEQAQAAAAEGDDEEEGQATGAKASSKPQPKEPKQRGRKANANQLASDTSGAATALADAEPAAQPAAAPAADAEPAPTRGPAGAAAPVVDTQTLNLF
jgi:PRTRC genetic system protein E